MQAPPLADSAMRKATSRRVAIPTSPAYYYYYYSGPPPSLLLPSPLAMISVAATRETPKDRQCVPISAGTDAPTDGCYDIACVAPGRHMPCAPATPPASVLEYLPKRAPAGPTKTYNNTPPHSLPYFPPACCRCIAASETCSSPPLTANEDGNPLHKRSNSTHLSSSSSSQPRIPLTGLFSLLVTFLFSHSHRVSRSLPLCLLLPNCRQWKTQSLHFPYAKPDGTGGNYKVRQWKALHKEGKKEGRKAGRQAGRKREFGGVQMALRTQQWTQAAMLRSVGKEREKVNKQSC